MRRIGVLMARDENDPEAKADLSEFVKGLAELGWTNSRNLGMDVRWGAGDIDRVRMVAKELVESQPDVIFAGATPATAALQRETRSIPIVFASVSDPIGDGFVASLPRPGGNITGFVDLEGSLAGQWLELLLEIAPVIKRASIVFNPDTSPGRGSYFLPSFEAAARSLNVVPIIAPVHSEAEIDTVLTSLGRDQGGGLVVPSDIFMQRHRATIISLADKNHVPAVYNFSGYVRDGGLLSYGPNFADLYRRAASYVDRIFRGAKPAELPVQLPVKFVMSLNVKTAKALGLTVPQSILLRADEVIQ